MKTLIVDDDQMAARLLSSYMDGLAQCSIANNGEEALNRIKQSMETGQPYELICLDILMPTIDGLETLRTIREFEQSTFNISRKRSTIVMTSALDDLEIIKRSFKELCDAYLTKPIKKDDFLDKLAQLGLKMS